VRYDVCRRCRKNPVIPLPWVCWECRRQLRLRRPWTRVEENLLAERYADETAAEIARDLRRSTRAVHQKALAMGLQKSDDFKRRGALSRLALSGTSFRFRPGNVPVNKGVKGRPACGRAIETQFKKGQLSGAAQRKWSPVGTEVVDSDGYRKRKVSDDRGLPSRANWRFCHVLLWEKHRGPVPDGHIIIFRDRDKTRIELENLELVTRKELMIRNSIHRDEVPEELRSLIQGLAGLRGSITKIQKRREAHAPEDVYP